MYQIHYQKEDGQEYIFQTQADSTLEAVEKFREQEHFNIAITKIERI